MLADISPQLIALAAALSYATSGISAKRGMRYSTPITVTLVSVAIHAVTLWTALLVYRGVPTVSWWVLFLSSSESDFMTGQLLNVDGGFHFVG